MENGNIHSFLPGAKALSEFDSVTFIPATSDEKIQSLTMLISRQKQSVMQSDYQRCYFKEVFGSPDFCPLNILFESSNKVGIMKDSFGQLL